MTTQTVTPDLDLLLRVACDAASRGDVDQPTATASLAQTLDGLGIPVVSACIGAVVVSGSSVSGLGVSSALRVAGEWLVTPVAGTSIVVRLGHAFWNGEEAMLVALDADTALVWTRSGRLRPADPDTETSAAVLDAVLATGHPGWTADSV